MTTESLELEVNYDMQISQQVRDIQLPAKHHITEIILRQEYQNLLHCGSQQLLAIRRERYWPLSGR
jgi:hypothetical protein